MTVKKETETTEIVIPMSKEDIDKNINHLAKSVAYMGGAGVVGVVAEKITPGVGKEISREEAIAVLSVYLGEVALFAVSAKNLWQGIRGF